MKVRHLRQTDDCENEVKATECAKFRFEEDFGRFNPPFIEYIIPNRYCYCGRVRSMYGEKISKMNANSDDGFCKMNNLANDVFELNTSAMYGTKKSLAISQILELPNRTSNVVKAKNNIFQGPPTTPKNCSFENVERLTVVRENRNSQILCTTSSFFTDRRLVSLFRSVALYWFFCLNTVLAKNDVLKKKCTFAFDYDNGAAINSFDSNELRFRMSPVIANYFEDNEFIWRAILDALQDDSNTRSAPVIRFKNYSKDAVFLNQLIRAFCRVKSNSIITTVCKEIMWTLTNEENIFEKINVTKFVSTSSNPQFQLAVEMNGFAISSENVSVDLLLKAVTVDQSSRISWKNDSAYGNEQSTRIEEDDGNESKQEQNEKRPEITNTKTRAEMQTNEELPQKECIESEKNDGENETDEPDQKVICWCPKISDVVPNDGSIYEHKFVPLYNMWKGPYVLEELMPRNRFVEQIPVRKKEIYESLPTPYELFATSAREEEIYKSSPAPYQLFSKSVQKEELYCASSSALYQLFPASDQEKNASVRSPPTYQLFAPSEIAANYTRNTNTDMQIDLSFFSVPYTSNSSVAYTRNSHESYIPNSIRNGSGDSPQNHQQFGETVQTEEPGIYNLWKSRQFCGYIKKLAKSLLAREKREAQLVRVFTDGGAFKYYNRELFESNMAEISLARADSVSKNDDVSEAKTGETESKSQDDYYATWVENPVFKKEHFFKPITPAFKVHLKPRPAFMRSPCGSIYIGEKRYQTYDHEFDCFSSCGDESPVNVVLLNEFQPKFEVRQNEVASQTEVNLPVLSVDDFDFLNDEEENMYYGAAIQIYQHGSDIVGIDMDLDRQSYVDVGTSEYVDTTLPSEYSNTLDFGHLY